MVISEGASVGTVITSVSALDADSGLNGRVGYALMNFKDTFKMGTVSKRHESVKTLQMPFFELRTFLPNVKVLYLITLHLDLSESVGLSDLTDFSKAGTVLICSLKYPKFDFLQEI